MWEIVIVWRTELATGAALLGSWGVFKFYLHRSFWRTFLPGALLGLAIELMTEPEWTYSAAWKVWRDICPAIVLGWGVVFSWLIVLSNGLRRQWFGNAAVDADRLRWQTLLTDFVLGMPMFLGNEFFGLHVLKVWEYNSILGWNTLIPVIKYPVEGLVAMVFFTLALPPAVRYWERTLDS